MPAVDPTAALARVDALHTALTAIVLEGGDLAGIAAEVARVLDLGVLVTSTDGRERAAHLAPGHRDLLEAAGLVDDTGRVRVERIDPAGTPLADGQVRWLRVAAGGDDLARIVVLRPGQQVGAADVHALERAATVAALLITREEAVTAVENKYRGDFLRDVFLGRAGDPAYVEAHARTFGWDLRRPVVVVAAELDPDEQGETSPEARRWQERFAAAWRQVTARLHAEVPTVDFSSQVVALLPVPDEEGPGVTGEKVVHEVVTEVAGDKGGGRRPFSVGVSRRVTSLEEMPDAFAQACRAVQVGRRVRGGASTTFFDQLGVHRLIALVPDAGELRAFVRDVLGPLAEDTTEARDLRETLRILLDTNFNVAEAARLQFFHYNTLRYRVGKLERLLGPLSSDPDLRLDVALALRVLELHDVAP
ncbi:PucR family transcriptional regulator [Nocardioides taihuensis]|uniref:PucR family transcriptional regulator n=1 Tax=Nocardioides taihuensis TaxID=1835606 RepID=A0ABW0BM31_9ACTN